MKKVNNKKGFTLAELLIVVAIIAVMVAIAIPTFGNQLERAREGVDLSAVRNNYSEAVTYFMTEAANEKEVTKTYSVEFKQFVSGWALDTKDFPCDDIDSVFLGDPELPGTIPLTFQKTTDANGTVTITLDSAAIRLEAADVGEGDDAAPNSQTNPFKVASALTSTDIKNAVTLVNADGYNFATTNPFTPVTIGGNVKLNADGTFERINSESDVEAVDATKFTIQAKVTKEGADDKTVACDVWIAVTV